MAVILNEVMLQSYLIKYCRGAIVHCSLAHGLLGPTFRQVICQNAKSFSFYKKQYSFTILFLAAKLQLWKIIWCRSLHGTSFHLWHNCSCHISRHREPTPRVLQMNKQLEKGDWNSMLKMCTCYSVAVICMSCLHEKICFLSIEGWKLNETDI